MVDYSFVEKDSTTDNDVQLKGPHSEVFTPVPIEVPAHAGGANLVLNTQRYSRTWAFTNCEVTRAEYDRLVTMLKANVEHNSTYPRLNVLKSLTPTYDVFSVSVVSLTSNPLATDHINRLVNITFKERSTSGAATIVVDNSSAQGGAVTVYLDELESVEQNLSNSWQPTQSEMTLYVGPYKPLACKISGWVTSTGDLDKLQQTLQSQTAVEVVGLAFDTTGSGYYSTNNPTTAVLTSLSSGAKIGGIVRVNLVVEGKES